MTLKQTDKRGKQHYKNIKYSSLYLIPFIVLTGAAVSGWGPERLHQMCLQSVVCFDAFDVSREMWIRAPPQLWHILKEKNLNELELQMLTEVFQ